MTGLNKAPSTVFFGGFLDQQRECYGYEKQYAQFRLTSLLTMKSYISFSYLYSRRISFFVFFLPTAVLLSIASVEISDFIC